MLRMYSPLIPDYYKMLSPKDGLDRNSMDPLQVGIEIASVTLLNHGIIEDMRLLLEARDQP